MGDAPTASGFGDIFGSTAIPANCEYGEEIPEQNECVKARAEESRASDHLISDNKNAAGLANQNDRSSSPFTR